MNYTIEGAPLPVVICNLEGGETMLTEKGAMSWMSPNMKMETTTGGGIGKMFGRAFSGESMFINRYTEKCLSRINCRRGNVCFFPKTHCRRSLRRRRIYHAASVRKRHRLSRI